MTTRSRDLDPGIYISFFGDGGNSKDGASHVTIYAYKKVKGEPLK